MKFLTLLLLMTLPAFAGDTIFKVTDATNDDRGAGGIRYPSGVDFDEGDLDLREFSAEADSGGVWFEVRFANKIRSVGNQTSRISSVPLKEILRYDFYTINVDIYVDTDGRPGSGNTSTAPGRKVSVSTKTAWERAILLTPRPFAARSLLEDFMTESEVARLTGGSGGLKRGERRRVRGEVERIVGEQFFFPRRISIRGRSIRFYVPDEFFGAKPTADWRYTVLVTGSDPEQRTDLGFLGKGRSGLLLFPLGGGRPFESFSVDLDYDPLQPPIIDVLLPTFEQQKAFLSDYDMVVGRLPVIPGIKPSAPNDLPIEVPILDETGEGALTTVAPTNPPITAYDDVVDSRPAQPQPAAPQPAAPQPAAPQPATPEPAAPEPAAPEPVTPRKPAVKPTPAQPEMKPVNQDELVVKPSPGVRETIKPSTTPIQGVEADVKPMEEAKPEPTQPSLIDRVLTPSKEVTKAPGERSVIERLRELEALLKEGLITKEEYQQLRRKILAEL